MFEHSDFGILRVNVRENPNRMFERTERSKSKQDLFERSIVRISALSRFRTFRFRHSTVVQLNLCMNCNLKSLQLFENLWILKSNKGF